ncbi:hypothetical protein [Polyangium sp. 15x6]|uniref:hypothetical protein n=1 Tax=Polyangium sp. 15x6 TaxID=3042687 RepID=UPI00249B50C1|nr:hypothetical protein [Polyangium sp. 15x6]MDI3286042.1 hypothetical protein [Polyangium sp. 15x6]
MQRKEHRPNDLPFWGADRDLMDRPGVPREVSPRPMGNAHWIQPEQQPLDEAARTRPEMETTRKTPIFSTALPPRGLSGKLRLIAYTIPDHRVRHWMLCIVADRVDEVQALFRRTRT